MRRPHDDQARELAQAAAHWLALIESGGASAEDHARLQQWRMQCPRHEQMWQKAQGLRQRFAQVPAQLALASLDRPSAEAGRRRMLKQALVLAGCIPGAWLLGTQTPLRAWTADLRTATGERRTLNLPDGSRLQLNTASAVSLRFRDGLRALNLIEGEVALDVVPGNTPLTIATRQGQVLVDSARLCIRLDAQRCRVAVNTGSALLLAEAGASQSLLAGQRAALGHGGIGAVEHFDPAQPDWRSGVLSVENRALGSFLGEVSRYRPGILNCNARVEKLKVTGVFRLDDTEAILDLLAASLPVSIERRTRYWVTVVPRLA